MGTADVLTWDDILVDPVKCEQFARWVSISLRVGATPWERYVSREEVTRRLGRQNEPRAAMSMWEMVKISREPFYGLSLTDGAGAQFRYSRGAHHDLAMEIEFADQYRGGPFQRLGQEPIALEYLTERMRREEARATCALDGHAVAAGRSREMFELGHTPRTTAELAVQKAYTTLAGMQSLRFWDAPSLDWLLQWHEQVTGGTTVRSDAPGRLRRTGEQPVYEGAAPADIPLPSAEELPERLAAVLAMFERKPLDYMSVEKGLLALFAITYLRPFAEGNGRMARALYYGFLSARHRDSPVQLVPLSSTLLRLRDPFGVWTRRVVEDRNDVGYFIHPLLFLVRGTMRRVQKRLFAIEDVSDAARIRFPQAGLNPRQIQVLAALIRWPHLILTVESHRRSYATVYETARTDLATLAELGLVRQEKQGRAFTYRAPDNLQARLGLPLPAVSSV